VISVILYLGALWHAGLYYHKFGINIFTYVNLTETLGLFVDKLPLMLVISLGTFGFFLLFQLALEDKISRLLALSRYNKTQRKRKARRMTYFMTSLVFIPGIFSFVLPTIFVGLHKTTIFIVLRAGSAVFIIFCFFNIMLQYREKYNYEAYDRNLALLTFILTFFTVIYYFSLYQVLEIKNKPQHPLNPRYTIIFKNDDKIEFGDSISLLGKTNNYLFLLKDNQANIDNVIRILRMDEVKEIKVKKSILWYTTSP